MEVYVDAREVEDLAAEMKHHATTVQGMTRAAVRKVGYDTVARMQRITVDKGLVDTGAMLNSESVDFDGLSFEAGPTVEYAVYVELGVPHPFEIRATPGHSLHFVDDGEDVFVKSVVHPPMPPRPFVAPAFDPAPGELAAALGAIGEQAVAP